MTRRFTAAILAVGFAGLTAFAVPFGFTWETTVSLAPDGGTLVDGFQSIVAIDYTESGFTGTSYSEFHAFGFLWQEFGAEGRIGFLDLSADVLFGPSTSEYLYAQLIAEIELGALGFGCYYAQLSDAVLGGVADGFALRMAGAVGALDVVSITEFGTRIADEDFDGIEIVHTASGFSRSYVTDPVVAGQGFTGQKVTVSGLSIGCVEEIETTLYLTCGGFEFLSFELAGIDTGIPWLTFDLEIAFEVQTKTVSVTPGLVIAEALCVTPLFGILPASGGFSLDGIVLGGFDLTYSWNGVTLRDVTILAPGRYAITTPEYGSVIETIADAVEDGHDFYADYWELLSLEIDGEACCGGRYALLLNTYFEEGAGGIFGWGMTYFEGSIGIGSATRLNLALTLDPGGLEELAIGFGFDW